MKIKKPKIEDFKKFGEREYNRALQMYEKNKDIQDGDLVEIVKSNQTYSTYKAKFKELNFQNKELNRFPEGCKQAFVFGRSLHNDSGELMFACVTADKKEFLIGYKGVSKL